MCYDINQTGETEGIHLTTRDQILSLFESNKGTYFSGEELAGRLQISRNAVWKAVKALQNSGYAIDAVTNKGYCLSQSTDILSVQGIQKYLRDEQLSFDLHVLATAGSTNSVCRDEAQNGAPEGYTVVANEQLKGRGRMGRSFFSPSDTGVYLSLLLRPNDDLAPYATRMTTMAAVAMCEAIEAISGEKAQIKWVNDILLGGKKVCGILTEASVGLESGTLEYAVLGLGVNLYPPTAGFPPDLRQIAGSVFAHRQADAKNRLVAEFLHRFSGYYRNADPFAYVEEYKKRSVVIGKTVTVLAGENERSAKVLGIDDACHLLVEFDNGLPGCLSSGEVRIKR